MFKSRQAKENAVIFLVVFICTLAMAMWKSSSILAETKEVGVPHEVNGKP